MRRYVLNAKYYHGYSIDQALSLLFRCDFDLDQAKSMVTNHSLIRENKWTEKETNVFFSALNTEKNFRYIQSKVIIFFTIHCDFHSNFYLDSIYLHFLVTNKADGFTCSVLLSIEM